MNIDPLLLEDIESPEHPSDFIAHENYSILILRLPEIKHHQITPHSYAFVIQEDGSAFFYDREEAKLKKLGSLCELNDFLDKKIEKLIKLIAHYHLEIEQLEESLYEDNLSNMFMQQWMHYKKNISLIHRFMFHASLTFELFITHHKNRKHDAFEELAYADVYEHIKRISDLSKAALERLDNLYDFYRAKVDERMNKNIYYLTILSGIFMPLTLVTGFFGMNTGGLFWQNDIDGTLKAILLSLVLELLIVLPFVFLNMKKTKRFSPK